MAFPLGFPADEYGIGDPDHRHGEVGTGVGAVAKLAFEVTAAGPERPVVSVCSSPPATARTQPSGAAKSGGAVVASSMATNPWRQHEPVTSPPPVWNVALSP